MLRQWITFGYPVEVIQLAYEMTIHATSNPSIPYAHKIILRWHEEGLATLADIQRAEDERKTKKEGGASVLGSSFDTDDLFQAALARSFRETGVQDGEN
jgi:DnaD/phage-associated family protein